MKPYEYSESEKQKIFDDICINVIEKRMSFNQAVKDSVITLATFYKILLLSDANKELYNYAREIRADVLFEEIIEISDQTENGETIEESDRGTKKITGDMIRHRQLKVDARKWVVSKMLPKKYGDKIDITSGNEKISQPQIIVRDDVQAKIIDDLLKKE